jgi:hypothetical protein
LAFHDGCYFAQYHNVVTSANSEGLPQPWKVMWKFKGALAYRLTLGELTSLQNYLGVQLQAQGNVTGELKIH